MTEVIPVTYRHVCDACGLLLVAGISGRPRNWQLIELDGEWACEMKELWCETCIRNAAKFLKDRRKP